MKRFIINLLFTMLGFYVIGAFVSFMPNPVDWDRGGRGAFIFFSLMGAAVYTALEDSDYIKNSRS
jgi:hypothetical protein